MTGSLSFKLLWQLQKAESSWHSVGHAGLRLDRYQQSRAWQSDGQQAVGKEHMGNISSFINF
jgi:hypothetical protein